MFLSVKECVNTITIIARVGGRASKFKGEIVNEELPKKKIYAAINKAFELGLIEVSACTNSAGESYASIEKVIAAYLDAEE